MALPTVLVAGAGSIGRRHIQNLRDLGATVIAWREREAKARELAAEFAIPVLTDLDAALKKVDAVVVATATDRHLAVALPAARAGKAMFIEKPIAHRRDGVAELAAACRNPVVEVGCQLRAHPTLQALKGRLAQGADGPVYTFRAVVGQRLDGWRPDADYRQAYSADAARGGGALLDLIHEIDAMNWLTGPVAAVSAETAKVSDLELRADDLANLTLTMGNGAVGQVQLDMLSPAYRREIEIVCRGAIYVWHYESGRLQRRAGGDAATIGEVPSGFTRNDLFVTHMRHFLRRLSDPTVPALCSFADGVAALDIALTAKQSAASGQRLTMKSDRQ
jgi:predicted dehydrogenase